MIELKIEKQTEDGLIDEVGWFIDRATTNNFT